MRNTGQDYQSPDRNDQLVVLVLFHFFDFTSAIVGYFVLICLETPQKPVRPLFLRNF